MVAFRSLFEAFPERAENPDEKRLAPFFGQPVRSGYTYNFSPF
jgi:hypothetical protein